MAKRTYQWAFARTLLFTTTLSFVGSSLAAVSAPVTLAAKPASSTVTPTPDVSTPSINNRPTVTPQAPSLDANGYVLMDANTGIILAHKNMHQQLQPASLTKLMTLYIAFQALKNGQIHLTDKVHVSEDAWKTGGSRMFIKEGSDVTVQDLIEGIIVASGNDACVALSEYVGGNEDTFVSMMNQAAQQLGMKDTHYVDSTGLPDPSHHSTPYDMALLTRAIILDFPEYYPLFKQEWITYNGIKQPNRNRLLWRDKSVDGLKTGHTQEAGYCLISSAQRDGMRLISVLMGAPTDSSRANDSQGLLNWGFRFYKSHKLYDANQSLATPRVWMGKDKTIPVGLVTPLYATVETGNYSQLKPEIDINQALQAPIKKGQVVGTLNVKMQGIIITSAPLVALKDNPKGNIISRTWDRIAKIV